MKLITENIKFVNDPAMLDPNSVVMYHRKKSAKSAQDEFVTRMEGYCKKNDIPYVISYSIDSKKATESNSSFVRSNDRHLVKTLDHCAKEPYRLIFFPGAIYQATCNMKGYQNSQTVVMIDAPTEEDILQRRPISMWAAPQGSLRPRQLCMTEIPSKEELTKKNWREIKVVITRDDAVFQKGPLMMHRNQYTLVHPNASTVNKQMGCTLSMPCAIEVRAMLV